MLLLRKVLHSNDMLSLKQISRKISISRKGPNKVALDPIVFEILCNSDVLQAGMLGIDSVGKIKIYLSSTSCTRLLFSNCKATCLLNTGTWGLLIQSPGNHQLCCKMSVSATLALAVLILGILILASPHLLSTTATLSPVRRLITLR